jgi:hypothetical protein
MNRYLGALAALTVMFFVAPEAMARATVGVDRNPESCRGCHGPHIIKYHNDNILGTPAPLDKDCGDCHGTLVTSVQDTSCDGCHSHHPFDEVRMDRKVGTWSMTGPMAAARFVNSASLLGDGRFLVTGGATPPFFGGTPSAEILDPQTRLWSSAPPMSTPRMSHQQTTLADGKVLITAGRTQISPFVPGAAVLGSAEIYDPATNAFLPAGSLNVARRSHRDILLADGRVLVTGGTTAVAGDLTSVSIRSAEVYDPSAGTFVPVGDMIVARQSHHLVRLNDGRVLVVGGGEGPGLANPTTTMEIFDPVTNTFSAAASMNSARMTTVATLLEDGRVLLAYAWNGKKVGRDSEIYDPATNTLTAVSGLPVHGKVDLLGIRLYDGTVVTPTGGNEFIQVLPDTSVYRPFHDDFILAGSVQFPRTTGYNTGALIPDGRIVASGGIGLSQAGAPIFFPAGEIYTPSDAAQSVGLNKLVFALPASAFRKPVQKVALQGALLAASGLLVIDGREAQARALLANQVIPRLDGCAGGNAADDWIKTCADQRNAHAVATRLVATLDELTGVLQAPQVAPTASTTSGTYPLSVSFAANASDADGSVVSHFWDFGNGTNSLLPSPIGTYACPGAYTAAPSVVDDDGLVGEGAVKINVGYPAGVSSSYKCDVLPAHKAFCGNQCHYAGSPSGGGIVLTSYASIMAAISTNTNPGGPIVIPGDPENSPIVRVTDPPRDHAHDVGGERLNDLVKAKQRAWIAEGALDN